MNDPQPNPPTLARNRMRDALIERIKSDDPDRDGSLVIIQALDTDWLVSVGSAGVKTYADMVASPIDLWVLRERTGAEEPRHAWQQALIDAAPMSESIGWSGGQNIIACGLYRLTSDMLTELQKKFCDRV